MLRIKRAQWAIVCLLVTLLCACASLAPSIESVEESPSGVSRVIAQDDRHIVVIAGHNESFSGLAQKYLNNPHLGWRIADFNNGKYPSPGTTMVVPLSFDESAHCCAVQSVPVLVYHRFGPGKSDMSVSSDRFAEQMQYLRDYGYQVVRLSDLAAFVAGQRPLPARSVIITVDDGHPSFYDVAYPVISSYGFPVTLFIYTDWVGQGGLNWRRLSELMGSGLIDIESHSKTHANMGVQLPGESDEAYRNRLRVEIADSRARLQQKLGRTSRFFAYPYGDSSPEAIEILEENGFEMAFTVQSGGNPDFASRYMMRRTMVLGKWDMQQFIRALEITKNEL